VPQIEVTFDIDANGILNVSARDQASGREQRVRIEPTSGLSEAEIQRMVREAEQHAAEDQRRREEVELLNRADNTAYAAERFLRDQGDRVPSAEKLELENQIQAVRQALERRDVNAVRTALESLERAMQQASQAAASAGAPPTGGEQAPPPPGEGTVEGEFREI
jgi:molecular chaperone DnaK